MICDVPISVDHDHLGGQDRHSLQKKASLGQGAVGRHISVPQLRPSHLHSPPQGEVETEKNNVQKKR